MIEASITTKEHIMADQNDNTPSRTIERDSMVLELHSSMPTIATFVNDGIGSPAAFGQARAVTIDADTYRQMGYPEKITVTIEPGDKLEPIVNHTDFKVTRTISGGPLPRTRDLGDY
jgi:hypothetical protein